MKKLFLLVALTFGMMINAQNTQVTTKKLQLESVPVGTKNDSLLVRGSDKIVKTIPLSTAIQGLATTEETNAALNEIKNNISSSFILSNNGYNVSGLNVTVNANWEWQLKGVYYTNSEPFIYTTPLSSAGKQRFDIVVLTDIGMQLHMGTESVSNPAIPVYPFDNLMAITFLVTDSNVTTTPTPNYELTSNKQNSLAVDGTGIKYTTVDAVRTHTTDINNPHNVTKSQVGLANVDNTSDSNKPISTATQTTLNAKANISGQVFTGAISATNLSGNNTGDNAPNSLYSGLISNASHTGEVTGSGALTIANGVVTNSKLANVATATIKGRVAAGSGIVEDLTSSQVRTLLNVADGANNYIHPANHPASIITQDASNRFVTDTEKSTWNTKESAIVSGTISQYWRGDKTWQEFPTIQTIDNIPTDGSNNAVSSNGVFDGLALKANLASPAFTGTPTSPTATAGTNTTQVATTAFVTNGIATANSQNVKLTGDQTISGQKSFSLTGKIDMQTNNAFPAIRVTSLGSNGGSAVEFINNSSSPYSTTLNLQTSLSGGVGNRTLDVSNISPIGIGIVSSASNGGVSISSQSGNGDSYVSNITSGGTGRNYVGRNNGIETYSVDKIGNVIGNSYIKRSAPANNILLAGGGDIAQGTAFNKNFGTTAGTVAGGNDSRILNGQTAFGWGNHAGLYSTISGSNINQSSFRTALGLGSNAYSSTAYLPLTGGDVSGLLKVIGDGRQLVLTGSDQGAIDLYKSGILGHRLFSDANSFGIYDLAANVERFSISIATGAATFASTVTAPTFIGSLSGNASSASNATAFGGFPYGGVYSSGTLYYSTLFNSTSNEFQLADQSATRTFLGLGSNAYTSTAYLPLSGGTLSGIVTAPTAPAGTNTTQIATTAFVQDAALPYKLYTFYVNQSGANIPTSVKLSNNTTLSSTPTWERTGVGDYRFFIGTVNTTKVFPYAVQSSGTFGNDIYAASVQGQYIQITRRTNGVLTDGLNNILFEIRQYP